MEIMDQIASGAIESGKVKDKDLVLIHKREEAVAESIKIAKKDDVIILLGKGHEKSILTNGPEAAKYRHELQNDDDPRRVIKREYDEVEAVKKSLEARDDK